jgi:mRNA interferase RelE/StbE
MRIKLSKKAAKFLNTINNPDKKFVLDKLQILYKSTQASDVFSLKTLDIKALTGEWKGYFRIRAGNLRIIFKFEPEQIFIEDINFRGSIY